MNETNPITDEDLTAFLDGELADDRASEIAAALEHDAGLRARRDALVIPQAALASAFDAVLATAPAPPALPHVQPQRRGLLAAGFAACLIAGTAIGLALNTADPVQQQPMTWTQLVAAYQALYVTDTLETIDPAPAEINAQLARFGAMLDLDLTRAADLPGVRYKRAQLLGFAGKPLVQIAYLTPAGEPVALCIIRNGKDDAPVAYKTLQGMAAGQWTQDGYGFLVIGGEDEAAIRKIVSAFSA